MPIMQHMLATLVTSRVRRTLLVLFLTHPEERFYQKQLIRELGLSSSLVQKELRNLAGIGFLTSSREANTRYFQVDKTFPLYGELKSIVYKTVGLADFLRTALHGVDAVRAAFIYGSVARNTEDSRSDIDVMVIGGVDQDALHEAVLAAEKALGREVNYSVFDRADWQKRLTDGNAFVTAVATGPKIFIVGSEDEL